MNNVVQVKLNNMNKLNVMTKEFTVAETLDSYWILTQVLKVYNLNGFTRHLLFAKDKIYITGECNVEIKSFDILEFITLNTNVKGK